MLLNMEIVHFLFAGTYAVRGIDVFNRVGPFSEEYEYVDI